MRNMHRTMTAVAGVLAVSAGCALAQDWPQWRGPNRDAKATGFTAPKTWPKELTRKWKVTVGLGDASPAVVGNKLYVFVRQDTNEVLRCLDAADGKELWQEKYDSLGSTGPAQGSGGVLVPGTDWAGGVLLFWAPSPLRKATVTIARLTLVGRLGRDGPLEAFPQEP